MALASHFERSPRNIQALKHVKVSHPMLKVSVYCPEIRSAHTIHRLSNGCMRGRPVSRLSLHLVTHFGRRPLESLVSGLA